MASLHLHGKNLSCTEPRLAELTGKRGRNPNHKIEGKRQVVLKQVRREAKSSEKLSTNNELKMIED